MKLITSLTVAVGLSILVRPVAAEAPPPGGAAPAAASAEESPAEREAEIRALKEQLEAIQHRLDRALEAERAVQAKAEAERAAADAAAAQAAAQARAGAQTAAPPPSVPPGRMSPPEVIEYRGVRITLGGFVAGETVYRSRDTGNDIATGYDGDYFRNNAVADTNQTVFTARQSRFSMLAEGAPSADTHLAGYAEFDLQGAAQTANSRESDSYNPSLRQLYAAVDWSDQRLHLLAGQAWSLATLDTQGLLPASVAEPPTIDAGYVPGFVWARQAQLRLTQDLADEVSLALSLENPQTTFYTGPNPLPAGINLVYEAPGTGLGYNSANSFSLNHIPDAVLKASGDPTIGDRRLHFEGYALYEDFYARLNNESESEPGGGFGGGMLVPLVPRAVELEFSTLVGRGIGRYGSAQLPDVTFNTEGEIRPIHEIMALAGLLTHPVPSVDVYLLVGEEKDSAEAFDIVTGKGKKQTDTPFGYGNVHYSNVGCTSPTATGGCIANLRAVEQATLGFWQRPYSGSYGTFRWGVQYSRTEFKAFQGVGGAPFALENMVFLSFRYYPFDGGAAAR